MSKLELHIKQVQDKLQQLLKQHHDLKKENKKLKETLEQSAKDAAVQKENIDALKQQLEILKISSGSWNDADKKQFEKRISSYVKEIDKCITMLKG